MKRTCTITDYRKQEKRDGEITISLNDYDHLICSEMQLVYLIEAFEKLFLEQDVKRFFTVFEALYPTRYAELNKIGEGLANE